jgi:colanic acid biosynthesis glycosyl transferase WcaI
MHILILNQTFHPDVAATGQLMWDLARHLARNGHRVSAVASRNYYGTDRRLSTAYEKIEGVEIHRLGGRAFGKASHLGRLADFASFYGAAFLHLQQISSPDVIYALTSPPMISSLAMLHRQWAQTASGRPVRFVYHLMDLYPDAAVANGVLRSGTMVERGLHRLTARTLDAADAVIALGRDMRQRLLEEYPRHARPDRIHVVCPWADGKELFPLEKSANPLAQSLGLGESFNVVYSGNLGLAHDLETMLAAIELTRSDANLRWLFIGGGKRFDELRRRQALANWPHVRLMDFARREDLNRSLNLADVHLVSQEPAFCGVVTPSKLFGILAVGRPAIMIGPRQAECARIVEESGAGFVVENGDGQQLAARLRQLRQDPAMLSEMGRRARNCFEANYDRAVACEKIEKILTEVVGGGNSSV